jgi:hypothetical protein
MTLWKALRTDLLPDASGCPVAKVDDAVKRTVIEWCKKTRCYRLRGSVADAGGLGARANPNSLVPAGTRLVSIIAASWLGKPLLPKSEAYMVDLYGEWAARQGVPLYLVRERADVAAGQFWLAPAPADATTTSLVMTVALTPTEDATGVDDSVLDEYREDIIVGALARLLSMSDRPWSQAGLAASKRDEFMRRMAATRISADRGVDSQPLTTKPYPF